MIDLMKYKKYGSFVLIIVSIILLAISGFGFALVHYTLEQTEIAFKTTDCVIENNTLVSSCQGLFELALYPFLSLRHLLVWISFFMIFGLVLGMLLLGYQSGKNPALLGIMVLFTIGLTYMGIEISNIYRGLLENEIFRNIMIEFTVYNRMMMNFPWFIFVVSLASLMLGIVNFQRIKVNTPVSDLDF